ncbi:MAG TPA: tetratricopeptide repeat protein, partial [Bacteroidota bacterium]|nr:tetratricopeptide repeat protein [Bacteroidota bacterium]
MEQGFGDAIQFVRFLPMAKARGGTVIFECQRELIGLFKGFPGIDVIVSSDTPVARDTYDFAVPLLSLPATLGLGEETVLWNGPYVTPDPQIVERYRDRFDGAAMHVGIVWAGSPFHRNDGARSCSKEEILALGDVSGIKLFGLQKHLISEESSLPGGIVDLGGELEDFSITAGIIAHLDLLVTVDTAVAHLAGAMGKRVWVLLPRVSDWRWQINREDSPWYPSMRLFRQTAPGWKTALDWIRSELALISGNTALRREEHDVYVDDSSVMSEEAGACSTAGKPHFDLEQQNAGAWFEIGTRFFNEGNIPSAENAFRAALDADPRSAGARNALAVVLTSRGAFDEAAEELLNAIKLDPGSAEAHYNLGNVRLKQSLHHDAEASYRAALEVAPGFIEARINLASALHAQKDEQGALGILREALAMRPDSPLILKQIGSLCVLLHDNQAALQAFERALQSDPGDAEAHVRIGSARMALNAIEEAASSFRTATNIDPTSAQAHAGLGTALQAQGKLEEAIVCFGRAVESAPSDATMHAQLGNALMENGDPAGALTAFEKALRLKPDYPEILNNMGLLLKEKGSLDVAEKCYRMAIRVRPDYPPPHNNLGSLLLERSLFFEAETCCRRALELQSDFHLARNNLANALAGQGRFEEAERLYRETIQANPSIPEVHFNLAASLANNLRFQEAICSYDDALRVRPEYPEAHLNRALISLLTGNLAEGWAGYEWRMKVKDPRRLYTAPDPDLRMWDGSEIAGKKILVRCEQGFGDTIQFSRFLPLLKERGARVVFECHRELCGLFEGFP